jgi:large subunit ribosomal protein L3
MPRVRWPKRGSRSYSPRKRAKSIVGRIDFWPEVSGGPQLLGFSGYKAGLTHVFLIENRERSPEFGKEVKNTVTVIDTPPMLACAIRAYEKTGEGSRALTEGWMNNPPSDLRRRVRLPEEVGQTKFPEKISSSLDRIAEVRILLATQPSLSSVPKKKPEIVEIKVGGGTIEEQLKYAESILGKAIKITDVFKVGEFVDAVGVTKGKGFQGPVKRWGVRILQNKARKTKRGVATTGPWHPARVMPGVPRAGQMGFHHRTEFNKRVLMIGSDGARMTPEGGFVRYGVVGGDFLALKGSVMGPAKRLIKLRKAARKKKVPDEPLKVTYVHTEFLKGMEDR